MERWKLVFSYDGTDFSGWQKQPDVRTVQGEAESAFSRLYQQQIEIAGQGRTDAGVHAEYQTAHVDLPDSFSRDQLLHAMNGLLPRDMALTDAIEAAPNFHARFDAMSRRYRYQVNKGKSPLKRNFCWEISDTPDLSMLNICADLITGAHDFINFCIPPENEGLTTICEVLQSEWMYENQMFVYRIEANRFLRHMVRRLTGTMVQVASGRLTYEDFSGLLSADEVKQKGFSAPPQGLFLEHVSYETKD